MDIRMTVTRTCPGIGLLEKGKIYTGFDDALCQQLIYQGFAESVERRKSRRTAEVPSESSLGSRAEQTSNDPTLTSKDEE